MKRVVSWSVVFCAVSFVGAVGHAAGGASSTLLTAPELTWSQVAGTPGVSQVVVEGDQAKGPSHFYLKFASGFAAPLHHHSANHYGTMISGTLLLTVDGKERRLPAGSYFSFSDKTPHLTKCEAGADCVMFIDARDKWDVVLAAKPAAKK